MNRTVLIRKLARTRKLAKCLVVLRLFRAKIRVIVIGLLGLSLLSCVTDGPRPRTFGEQHKSKIPVTSVIHGYGRAGHTLQNMATFAFYIPEERASDLEYESFVRMFEVRLIQRGWVPTDIKKADYIILLVYGIDQGRSEMYSYNVPTYGMISSGVTSYHSGTLYGSSGIGTYSGTSSTGPIYGYTGSQHRAGTKTIFTRHLVVDVFNRKDSDKEKKVVVDWSVRTRSEGQIGDVAQVLPYMIESTAKRFAQLGTSTVKLKEVAYLAPSAEEANKKVSKIRPDRRQDYLLGAVETGDYYLAVELLALGADPNTTDRKGRSVLMLAAHYNRFPIVQELLKAGAIRESQDRDGRTALSYAVQRNNISIAELLKSE